MKKTTTLDDLAAFAGIRDRDLAFIRQCLLRAGLRLATLEYFSTYHALWNTTPANRDGTLLTARDDRRWRLRMQPVKAALSRLLHAAISLRYDRIVIPARPVATAAPAVREESLSNL
jgi:hypothetical protein